MANTITDFGINILEEEIDDVIFQTNQFLTDATFTGSQGPFWWFLQVKFDTIKKLPMNQSLTRLCSAAQIFDGTKTGQKLNLSIQRPVCSDALFKVFLHPHATKVLFCPVANKKSFHISRFFNSKPEILIGFNMFGRNSRFYFHALQMVQSEKNFEKIIEMFLTGFQITTLPIISLKKLPPSGQCNCQEIVGSSLYFGFLRRIIFPFFKVQEDITRMNNPERELIQLFI